MGEEECGPVRIESGMDELQDGWQVDTAVVATEVIAVDGKSGGGEESDAGQRSRSKTMPARLPARWLRAGFEE